MLIPWRVNVWWVRSFLNRAAWQVITENFQIEFLGSERVRELKWKVEHVDWEWQVEVLYLLGCPYFPCVSLCHALVGECLLLGGVLLKSRCYNVNPGLINPLPPPPPYTKRSRRCRRCSIDFSVTNPPEIKEHQGLRKTGQLIPTTQQENDCDWPISKWGGSNWGWFVAYPD